MEATFPLNKEEFCTKVLEIFEVLSLCVRVKTNIEINKVIHEKTKELKDKKTQLESAEKHKVELDILGKIYPQKVSEEQKKKNKEEIEILKSEIEKLEKELKNS